MKPAWAVMLLFIARWTLAAPPIVHPERWPKLPPRPRDARVERRVDELLARMSVEEKVGQVIQASITSATPDDVRTYHLGSVLNGGGGWPSDVRKARAADWLAKADAYYDASMKAGGIPIMWGADAVHGHNNVIGATLFPHNIGLGAANDPELVRRIGEITADEMAVTGLDWDFFPNVAVVQDARWGRTYESYSEDPALVARLARPFVEGLQSQRIIATAKHFLGDGGTDGGKDQGDNLASEAELRDVHGAGYVAALRAGVETVMASFSSWHGVKMHANRDLLTAVLKKRLGFDGFVVGDWNGHAQVPGCSNADCAPAFNAGIDMFMVPDDWKALYANLLSEVRSGVIQRSRLDDAVRRILRVKVRAGLFDKKPSQRALAGRLEHFGSVVHRDVARRAVRESLVLLKNDDKTLPLSPKSNVVVMGDGADNIPKQAGGWTITWQGDGNSNADFPGATSIWEGIRRAVEAAGGHAALSGDGAFEQKPDVAIVVYGENPYAEFRGDRRTLAYSDPRQLAMLRRLKADGVRIVSVFLSGRPLWTNPFINASDAFVAAWLPGTEGGGVADALFGRSDFRGRLSFSWPAAATENARIAPLFRRGYGLTFGTSKNLPTLPEPEVAAETADGVYVASGAEVAPWKLTAGGGVTMEAENQESRTIRWPAGGGELAVRSQQSVDLTREANGGVALSMDLMLRKVPAGRVMLNGVDVTSVVARLPVDQWSAMRVPLRCFGSTPTRAPVTLTSTGELALTLSDVKLVPGNGEPCPR